MATLRPYLAAAFLPRTVARSVALAHCRQARTRNAFSPRTFAISTRTHARGQGQDPDDNKSPKREALKDRQKVNTDASEYSRSGSDDETAANEDAAFDPNITNPQDAKDKAGEGNEVNPLDASPANEEISQGTREETSGGGEERSVNQ